MRRLSARTSGASDDCRICGTRLMRSSRKASVGHSVASCSMILDNILFADRSLEVYDAFAFELAYQADDLLLRGLDVADLDRTEALHVFLEHLRASLRHAFEEVIAQLLAGAFECNGEDLTIDARQDLFDPVLVDEQQILED